MYGRQCGPQFRAFRSRVKLRTIEFQALKDQPRVLKAPDGSLESRSRVYYVIVHPNVGFPDALTFVTSSSSFSCLG